MKKLWKRITGRVTFDISDIGLILGVASAFYGLFCIYRPAAFIALGGGLIYWAIQLERGNPNG